MLALILSAAGILLPTPYCWHHDASGELHCGPPQRQYERQGDEKACRQQFCGQTAQSKNDLLDTEAAKNTKNIDNQSKFKPKRSIRTADLIVTVIADVGADH
jgi:hypothetical protein